MPQSLPVHIFLEHMAKYIFRNVVVWLRAVLAVGIWICGLPLSMRAVWSFMFWISDEGLGGSLSTLRGGQASWEASLYSEFFGQCSANPLVESATTTLAQAATMIKNLPGDLSGIPKFAVKSIGYAANTINGTGSFRSYRDENGTITVLYEIDSPSASLLSNVTFLRNLTQSPRVNRTVMSIIEGQIITILVVICFILIILVRDYVVQQQPELNMRAAFADQEEAAQVNAFDAGPAQPAALEVAADDGGHESDDDIFPTYPRAYREFILPPAEVHTHRDLHEMDEQEAINQVWAMTIRPGIFVPGPEAEEEPSHVMEYLRIFRRAHGDHDEILRIIEQEDTAGRLRYWADATRRAISNNRQDGSTNQESALASSQNIFDRPDTPAASSSHYVESPSRETNRRHHQRFEPATPVFQQEPAVANSTFANGLRPRASSEGPSRSNSIHPLANNSWTFEGLPTDEPESTHRKEAAQDTSDSPHGEGIFGDFDDSNDTTHDSVHSPTINHMQGQPFELDLSFNVAPEPEATAQPLQTDTAVQTDSAPQTATAGALPGAVPANNAEPVGLVGRVADFMWGDLDHHIDEQNIQAAAEHDADDDAWVDVVDGDVGADDAQLGADDMEDADDFDQEAIDEMEDFEGVMELIGMRGPIAGLFQNAVFCAVLVSVTIFACIFVPYNIGRVTLWLMASPMRLVRMIVEISKLIQDALVMGCAFVSWGIVNLVEMATIFLPSSAISKVVSARKACWALWVNAGSRIFDYLFMDFPMSATEIQNFSAISHSALLSLKGQASRSFGVLQHLGWTIYANGLTLPNADQWEALGTSVKAAIQYVIASSSLLLTPDAWVINLGDSQATEPVNPELARWSGGDRFWAILAGYGAVFGMAAMYLQRNSPFSNGEFMRAWEAGVIDTLQQASGIMKVILIISIEMLVFPLYCGLLLDLALLPLFDNTTVLSRLMFTRNYPATSVFVHWFVGTGYMFHFALFVSMCRKIMRPGVLYFIRDPDDPEFHPVRDVLERNLITQLRKILFSAFVYGALVIICLGGVVWGLSTALPTVLPIHYSSNEPVLEFPVDLLFYNFLMPLAIKFFKPGDGIHAMYTWWFRRCARALRLTSFLFGDRKIDEEGNLRLSDSEGTGMLRSLFLGVDQSNKTVVKSWKDTIAGDVGVETEKADPETLKAHKEHLVQSKQLVVDGKFVRAPASDRVKITKGRKVFLAVDGENKRQDGNEDNDLYASDQYRNVYVPPRFKSRIFLFILFIWIFAAFTGVGLTIAPLVIGRMIFKALIPDYVRTNDIYAFSIGICILGVVSYLAIYSRSVLDRVHGWMMTAKEEVAARRAASRAFSAFVWAIQLLYTYFFLAVVFPLLIALLLELYVAIPLHTYRNPPTAATMESDKAKYLSQGRHTVRLTQGWTLGLLYIKLGSRMITSLFPESRAAVAVRTVLRRGWQRPDVGVFTRAFVIPGLVISFFAIFAPPFVARYLVDYQVTSYLPKAGETAEEMAKLVIFYRYSYPGAAVVVVMVKNAMMLAGLFNGWTLGLRPDRHSSRATHSMEPPSSPPSAGATVEDALSWYKSQYVQLEVELAEFRESSRELEQELEKDIERAEKQERVFQERAEALGFEVEEWKRKYKESKTEAASAQNALEKEITVLRNTNRALQMKLRDSEVANDDFERQARNTTSSLEDMESKFNQAIERGVIMDEEMQQGEQERERLRIESQRLREELGDLKIEAELMQDKLKKHEARQHHLSIISTDMSALGSPTFDRHTEMSPNSTASSPLITTPPPNDKPVSEAGTVSDINEPPSPPMSEMSNPMPRAVPAKTPVRTLQRKPSRLPSMDQSVTPKPRAKSTTTRMAAPRLSGAGASISSNNRTPANNRLLNSRTASHKLPASNSLSHIRTLTEKMQRLEARVHNVRSKLPGPASSPPRASPRSAKHSNVPSSVTVRSRKRTAGSATSSITGDETTPTSYRPSTSSRQGHVPRLSTSNMNRLSFGPLPNRAPDADSSRPSSRASMSSYARPPSRTEMAPPRPMSRTSTRTPLSRPRSSMSLHSHSHSISTHHLDLDIEEEHEGTLQTPSRRGTYGKVDFGSSMSGIPMPGGSSIPTPGGRRQSAGRRTSVGVGREPIMASRPSTAGGRKLADASDLGETY
ncbi:RING finger membrane [Cordyceps militaris]|uniref:RING-type E3 ubiquitin transferase n=1 Tax=Cordyceps militaris TaxID=73501 RepID=A0A2H4SPH2_CORMI|nr:RING finger membrane [Cordyceps militaris]